MTPVHGCCPRAEKRCQACLWGTDPREYQVVIAGVQVRSCADCATLDGTYTLTRVQPCLWRYTFPSTICLIDQIALLVHRDIYAQYVFMDVSMGSDQLYGATWASTLGAAPQQDCAVSGKDIPFFEDGLYAACSFSGATCTVTAL